MRILQVITDTDRRGAQVFATDLHEELARGGDDVQTVALAPGRNPVRLDVPVLGPRRLAPATLRRLRRLIRTAGVVVAHGSSTLPACAIASAGTGVPFVYRQVSELAFWTRGVWRTARVRLFLSRARLVVTLSEGMRDYLVRRLGVAVGKVRLIPNGVPARDFGVPGPAERRRVREGFGLDPARPVALYLGALVPEKGVDIAVEAVRDLPDVQLLVVGDGPERPALERLAARGAAGRVRFTGSLDRPQAALAAADVVVLPSRAGDVLPATLVEAAFSGLPAVSTPVGAIPEVVLHGETGMIVPIGDVAAFRDAVAALLGRRDLAEAMGRRAREHCLARYEIGPVAAAWRRALADVTARTTLSVGG